MIQNFSSQIQASIGRERSSVEAKVNLESGELSTSSFPFLAPTPSHPNDLFNSIHASKAILVIASTLSLPSNHPGCPSSRNPRLPPHELPPPNLLLLQLLQHQRSMNQKHRARQSLPIYSIHLREKSCVVLPPGCLAHLPRVRRSSPLPSFLPLLLLDALVRCDQALFRALTRHRPVGPDKHFKMVGLLNVVNKSLVNIEGAGGGPEGGVTSDEIWDKLGKMFDLGKLDMLVS